MANAISHLKADIPKRPTEARDPEVTWVVWRVNDPGRAFPEPIWKSLNSHTSGIYRSNRLKDVDPPSFEVRGKGLDWTWVDIGALDCAWIVPDQVEPFEHRREASSTTGFLSTTGQENRGEKEQCEDQQTLPVHSLLVLKPLGPAP